MSTYLPTIKQLQYLVALHEHGHFGKAADASFVSQSTLSAGIRELESLLGVRLIGATLHLAPRLPADWPAFMIHYRYRETVYHIAVVQTPSAVDARRGTMSVTVDGNLRVDAVIPLVDDQRSAVVTGACRHAGPGHQHEAGLVAGVVGDVGSHDLEAVEDGGGSGRDGGCARAHLGDEACGVGRGVGGTHVGMTHVLAQVGVTLRGGDGDRHDDLDVIELRAGLRQQAVLDVEHDLALDE